MMGIRSKTGDRGEWRGRQRLDGDRTEKGMEIRMEMGWDGVVGDLSAMVNIGCWKLWSAVS